MDGRTPSVDEKEASASFFLSRRSVPRWTCGQPAAPHPAHRVHQGDFAPGTSFLGSSGRGNRASVSAITLASAKTVLRRQNPAQNKNPIAPIILPANSGRNIVAAAAPTASLAIASLRLLNAWRRTIRLLFASPVQPSENTARRHRHSPTAPGVEKRSVRSAEDHCRTA